MENLASIVHFPVVSERFSGHSLHHGTDYSLQETSIQDCDQYFGQTLAALQQDLSYVLNELEELSVWQMTKQDNAGEHPRLPLIMRHNEMVKNIFLMVQHNLDSMR